jgi:hypothetical protein
MHNTTKSPRWINGESSESVDRNFRLGMAIASRILLSTLLMNLPGADHTKISTNACCNKLSARGKSLSVNDLTVAGLAPNSWVNSTH